MASSTQKHRTDGLRLIVGLEFEQNVVCSHGLVVEVEAAVLLKSGFRQG